MYYFVVLLCCASRALSLNFVEFDVSHIDALVIGDDRLEGMQTYMQQLTSVSSNS